MRLLRGAVQVDHHVGLEGRIGPSDNQRVNRATRHSHWRATIRRRGPWATFQSPAPVHGQDRAQAVARRAGCDRHLDGAGRAQRSNDRIEQFQRKPIRKRVSGSVACTGKNHAYFTTASVTCQSCFRSQAGQIYVLNWLWSLREGAAAGAAGSAGRSRKRSFGPLAGRFAHPIADARPAGSPGARWAARPGIDRRGQAGGWARGVPEFRASLVQRRAAADDWAMACFVNHMLIALVLRSR